MPRIVETFAVFGQLTPATPSHPSVKFQDETHADKSSNPLLILLGITFLFAACSDVFGLPLSPCLPAVPNHSHAKHNFR